MGERFTPLPPDLAARAQGGRLAHAYILMGREAGELARSLSAAMVCTGAARPCGACRACRKVLGGVHPDVITLAPEEGKDFTVAQARALRADAYVTPNEGERKVYVLENAQRMNQNAQNALLKVLEEGPRYAAFLLLTENPDALLPTVRSRCECVRAGGQSDREDEGEAGELARLLLGRDPWARIQWCVPREKKGREETLALWETTRRLLTETGGGDRRRAAQLAVGLGELLGQARQNVSTGTLWGALYALAGDEPEKL